MVVGKATVYHTEEQSANVYEVVLIYEVFIMLYWSSACLSYCHHGGKKGAAFGKEMI